MELILSLYPGIDLLGRGFEAEGFSVVRGPDLIWGQSIENFHTVPGRFDGVIAGSPCQDFSRKRRAPPTGKGDSAIAQFTRVVTEALPDWWLLENVPSVPDVSIAGYRVQRFDLSARECGLRQSRLRHFQFGSKTGLILVPERDTPDFRRRCAVTLEPCCLATEGQRKDRRSFSDFCELQGLPREFDLRGWPIKFKYAAVGNGVPLPMGRVIARAIVTARSFRIGKESRIRLCVCGCGRIVTRRQRSATPACRKRLQRRRDSATAAQRRRKSGVSQ